MELEKIEAVFRIVALNLNPADTSNDLACILQLLLSGIISKDFAKEYVFPVSSWTWFDGDLSKYTVRRLKRGASSLGVAVGKSRKADIINELDQARSNQTCHVLSYFPVEIAAKILKYKKEFDHRKELERVEEEKRRMNENRALNLIKVFKDTSHTVEELVESIGEPRVSNVTVENSVIALMQDVTRRVTKTLAKSMFLLDDESLGRLGCDSVPNPHYRSAAPMQLYNLRAVMLKAQEKYGSLENVEKEKERREDEAEARKQKRMEALLRREMKRQKMMSEVEGGMTEWGFLDKHAGLDDYYDMLEGDYLDHKGRAPKVEYLEEEARYDVIHQWMGKHEKDLILEMDKHSDMPPSLRNKIVGYAWENGLWKKWANKEKFEALREKRRSELVAAFEEKKEGLGFRLDSVDITEYLKRGIPDPAECQRLAKAAYELTPEMRKKRAAQLLKKYNLEDSKTVESLFQESLTAGREITSATCLGHLVRDGQVTISPDLASSRFNLNSLDLSKTRKVNGEYKLQRILEISCSKYGSFAAVARLMEQREEAERQAREQRREAERQAREQREEAERLEKEKRERRIQREEPQRLSTVQSEWERLKFPDISRLSKYDEDRQFQAMYPMTYSYIKTQSPTLTRCLRATQIMQDHQLEIEQNPRGGPYENEFNLAILKFKLNNSNAKIYECPLCSYQSGAEKMMRHLHRCWRDI